ncbi:hypothetical protein DSO57_1003751 [Entomophthora muscae]|uniref:Uncharacterized protein n=1 Tax=Entomophthora muscae TaxID=34485 RepID=A0ACC2TIZ8_9FUNG|nr:hypothetical protein DSO57_1003751 [Entomophthora muscae]
MHKRHSSTIPPTLLVRDSNTSTLHDLRLLITTDKFQKVEESRDIERVLTQLKALKQASRELHSTRDRCEALQEAFKKEGDPSFFYSLYKLHFQNLQHKIIDRRLNDPSLSTSPLASLSQRNISTVSRFLSFLRSNPQTIAKALCNHHSEDLYNLIKVNSSVLKPTSIPDILLYSLFDSPNFIEEQKLRQDLWKDIFVSLIKDKKGGQLYAGSP